MNKIKLFGITIGEIVEEKQKQKYDEYSDGKDGYWGPKKLKPLYDAGINPRCGMPLSRCREGLAHAHLDDYEDLRYQNKKLNKSRK